MKPYIPVFHGLHETLEVMQIAEALNVSAAEVIGRLVILWSWLDRTTEDWTVVALPSQLDKIVGLDGLTAAVAAVGWASDVGGRIVFPLPEGHSPLKAVRKDRSDFAKRRPRSNTGRFSPQKTTTDSMVNSCGEIVRAKSTNPPQESTTRPVVDDSPSTTRTLTRTLTLTHSSSSDASTERMKIRSIESLQAGGVSAEMMSRAVEAVSTIIDQGRSPLTVIEGIGHRCKGKRNKGAYLLASLESEAGIIQQPKSRRTRYA